MKKAVILGLTLISVCFTGCSLFDFGLSKEEDAPAKKDVIVFTEDDIHHEPEDNVNDTQNTDNQDAAASEAPESTEALDNISDDGNTDTADGGEDTDENKTVTVAGNNVNVRDYPSTDDDSKVIGSAKAGDEFEFVAVKDDWTQIVYEGKEGYIKTEFLKSE